MCPTYSVDSVKDKAKRRAKASKAVAFKRCKRNGISTYRRLAAVFRRRISSGEWQAGDRLPALDALVKELRVGRITVRHALDLLAE
jgi:DNA-binding GntR family transcriptional regulator